MSWCSMCSVAMNFSKLAICFIVRVCVRWSTVSSEHVTSGATTYSFASTSGGAHGRIETGGAGAGGAAPDTLAELFTEALGEFPADAFGDDASDAFGPTDAFGAAVEAATRFAAGESAALSSATSAFLASLADGSAG